MPLAVSRATAPDSTEHIEQQRTWDLCPSNFGAKHQKEKGCDCDDDYRLIGLGVLFRPEPLPLRGAVVSATREAMTWEASGKPH